MSSLQLWEKLKDNNVVNSDQPVTEWVHIPWYIRFMQGFAGWLAALFLLGFFGTAFGFLFQKPIGGLLITVGVLCSVGAYMLIRTAKNDFLDQLGMAFSLCGQLMVAIGLFFLLHIDSKASFLLLGLYQLILAWFIPQYAHRVLTTAFGLLALLIALNLTGFYSIGSVLVAVLFSFIWLKETTWGKLRQLWEAIGFGVTLCLVFSSGFLITGKFLFREFARNDSSWMYVNAELINSVLIALVFVNVVLILLKEYKVKMDSKTTLLSFAMAVVLVLIGFKIYGLSTGLLILIIGFARQRATLMTLGGLSILSFFSWYYYNLQETLLFKSIVLMVLGFGFIVAKYLLNFFYGEPSSNSLNTLKIKKITINQMAVVLTVSIVLIAINLNIKNKEELKVSGEKLLFPMAPVDPRSLMQGDYMRLRFDLAVNIQKHLRLLNHNKPIKQHQGFVVVEKDDKDVVSFIGLYHNQELTKNQMLIPYKYRGYQVLFTTNAFYFQEGQASHFQKSKFGEFRRSKDGEMLLVHMLDKDFKRL